MSLIKKFANAVRTRTGQKPLIVTTSEFTEQVQTRSPLVEMFTKRDSTITETLPCRLVAVASEGLRKPEQQLWTIKADIEHGRFSEDVATSITYDKMIAVMKQKELAIARKAGVSGDDASIIARRKGAVRGNNIFKFVS